VTTILATEKTDENNTVHHYRSDSKNWWNVNLTDISTSWSFNGITEPVTASSWIYLVYKIFSKSTYNRVILWWGRNWRQYLRENISLMLLVWQRCNEDSYNRNRQGWGGWVQSVWKTGCSLVPIIWHITQSHHWSTNSVVNNYLTLKAKAKESKFVLEDTARPRTKARTTTLNIGGKQRKRLSDHSQKNASDLTKHCIPLWWK